MSFPGILPLARNAAYLAGTQFVGLMSRVVWVIAAAKLLGPDLYAVLAYSQAWQLAFLPLALFGVGPAMAYLIAPDRGRAADIAAQSLAIRLLAAIVAAFGCFALSRVVSPDPRAEALIAVLVVALIGRALTMWAQSLFAAFEVNQHTMRQETLFAVLDMALALAILFGGGSLLLLVSAKAGVMLLQAGWSLSVVHRYVTPVALSWQWREWRPLLALAFPALLITLASDWRFNGSLVLFRNLAGDGVLFSQFALAMQALTIIGVLPLAVSSAAYPALRRAVTRGDGRDVFYASLVQRLAPLAGVAAGLGGLALGEPVFGLVFGEAYSVAGQLVGLTLWCVAPLVAGYGYPQVLIARGQFRAMVMLSVAGALFMTAGMALLVPGGGVAGAIVATFIGFAVPALGALVLARQQGLVDPARDIWRPLAVAGAALVGYLALAGISRGIALVAGLVILAAGTVALRIVRIEEFRQLRRAPAAGGPPRRVLMMASTLPRWAGDAVPAFVLDQAIALQRRQPGLEIRILAPHDAGAALEEDMNGIRVHRFRYFWPQRLARLVYPAILPNLRRNRWLYLQVPGLFVAEFFAALGLARCWRPDVIYSHWFTPQAIVGAVAALLLGVPHVFTTHSSDVQVLRRVPLAGPWLVRWVTRRAFAFTAVSRRTLARLQAFFPDPGEWAQIARKGSVLPMGTAAAGLPVLESTERRALRSRLGLGDAPVILFLGRLTEKKGIADLLDAFRILAGKDPDLQLVIAGEGEQRPIIEQRLADLGLAGRVRMPGFVTGERKRDLLLAADVLAVPSVVMADDDAEGLPVSLLEGLAAGAVCVATDVSGADDILTNGEDGFLVSQADPAALAQALGRALDLDAAARRELTARGRARAQQFDWPAVADAHWHGLFENVRS
jgi:glycosyltransferase involved in cell wall biosynthesis/O-antigen/teichoic acid export membrane protein